MKMRLIYRTIVLFLFSFLFVLNCNATKLLPDSLILNLERFLIQKGVFSKNDKNIAIYMREISTLKNNIDKEFGIYEFTCNIEDEPANFFIKKGDSIIIYDGAAIDQIIYKILSFNKENYKYLDDKNTITYLNAIVKSYQSYYNINLHNSIVVQKIGNYTFNIRLERYKKKKDSNR